MQDFGMGNLENEFDPLVVGRKIRELRTAQGMNLEVLARAIERAPSQVSAIENGKRTPPILQLQKIANALGVTLNHLLSAEKLSERSANELEIERAQRSGLYASLGLPDAFIGKTVMEAASVFPGVHFMPIALKREDSESTIIPRGNTIFCECDHVYFITNKKGLDELYNLMGTEKQKVKNVMILGAGRVGSKLSKELSAQGLNIKLIEINEQKANDIAEELPDLMVLNVDGRNLDLLVEENLENMDAFISTSGDSETNIMSCMMAKSKKVKKTIALVENMDYFNLSQSIGIDSLINKKLLAANDIFKFVRNGDIVELAMLNDMDAEIVEFIVNENSKVLNKKIMDLDFPLTAIIGGVIRNNEGVIALGGFEIKLGDRVLVCSKPESIKKVESLFL